MARYYSGILGQLSGKVGAVVASNWKGIHYLRSVGRKRKSGSGTPDQIEQRAKFSLVTNFLAAVKAVITFGYKELPKNQSEYNAALADSMNAVSGTFPELTIDYAKAFVTKGKLKNAEAPGAASIEPGNINFSWTDNSEPGKGMSDDKAVLVAYCESLNQAAYKTAGAARHTGVDTLSAKAFSGKEVHTWIAFVSSNEKDISQSIYCGKLIVQ